MQEQLREGLTRAMDAPVRQGYLEAMAGITDPGGPFARGELGWHPAPPHAVFGFGEWTPERSSLGLGWRYRW